MIKKKLNSLLALTITSMILMLPIVTKAETNHQQQNFKRSSIQTTKETLGIKQSINKYFDNELQSIKIGQVVTSNDIITNDFFKEYDFTKNQYFSTWFNKLGYKLIDYKLYIDFNSIDLNLNGDQANVIITKDTDMTFDKDPNIVQKAVGDVYILKLQKINNKWLILECLPQEENKDNQLNKNIVKAISFNPYQDLKQKFSDLEADLNLYKNNCIAQPENDYKFDTTKAYTSRSSGNYISAVNYARNWALGRNHKYNDYKRKDCTNFVSQCLDAGNVSHTNDWWFKTNPRNSQLKSDSKAWRCVPEFYTFLIKSGRGKNVSASNVGRAGIIQLYNGSRWFHSVIVTSINTHGTIYYCGHSNERKDYGLYNVYPSSSCKNIRYINVSY